MYDIYSDITTAAGLSKEQLSSAARAMRPDNGFTDFYDAVIRAEKEYGINALFIAAHAAVESAWGTSHYATARNNLFGFNATDSNPDQASYYGSQSESVMYYAAFLRKYYLTPGAMYFNGKTPHGIFVKYSSSHDSEAQTVVSIMNRLAALAGDAASPVPQATPVEKPAASHEYDVKPGDTLWAIANGDRGLIERIIQVNRPKYPSIGTGIEAHLEAGWRIYLPSEENPIGTSTQPVYITVPSGRQGWLGTLAANYGVTVKQIITWNKERYPSIGDKVGGVKDYIQEGWTVRVQ